VEHFAETRPYRERRGGVFAGGSFLRSFRLRERCAGDSKGNSEGGGGEHSAGSGKCAVHDFFS